MVINHEVSLPMSEILRATVSSSEMKIHGYNIVRGRSRLWTKTYKIDPDHALKSKVLEASDSSTYTAKSPYDLANVISSYAQGMQPHTTTDFLAKLQRRFLVYLNPVSGTGRSLAIWNEAKTIFDLTGEKESVI